MFKIGHEFKNSKNETLAVVVNVIKRGITNGFEPQYKRPLYIVKRPVRNGRFTIVTISEKVLLSQDNSVESGK